MGIRAKLFGAVLALAIPLLIIVGVFSYLGGKAAVKATTLEHLTSVRASKANEIEEYIKQVRSLVRILATDRMVVDAMMDFDAAYQRLQNADLTIDQRAAVADFYRDDFVPHLEAAGGGVTDPALLVPTQTAALYLQFHYILANTSPQQERDLLDDAGDGSEYSEVHGLVQPVLRQLVEELGFSDLILISGNGTIVYTESKEVDLGTNLNDGPYQASNLAHAFHEAASDYLSDAVHLVDFAPYIPALGEPASFMAAPIVDGGWLLGVLAIQIPVGKIDDVMTSNRQWEADGLGQTGESYLVGPDFTMRSNSRFFLEDPAGYLKAAGEAGTPPDVVAKIREFGTTILHQSVRTAAAEAAMAGETATRREIDYRGVEVLSSFSPLSIDGVDWVILSEIDEAEAFARVRILTRNLVLTLAGLLGLVLVAAWFLSRRFVAPIIELDDAARQFASGREDVEVPVARSDELGGLARSFNRMVAAIRQKTTDLERTADEIADQKQLLEITLESLTHPFYVIDAEDYTIQIANSAARRLGASGNTTCHALSHKRDTPCDEAEHPCPLREVKKTKQPVMVEHIHPDAEGNPRYMEVRGYPIFDDDGNVVQMIEYSLDVTERKLMEIQLEEARSAAEAANRAKSTFLANMSHELRTPMNAIIGYSEMLAEDAEDAGHDDMIPDLEKINAAGKHLLALINEILDLSKIEAGRMDVYLETFDLRQMLDEAVNTVVPLVAKNDSELVTDFAENLGTVRLDLTKIRQALFNLLSNAAKFTNKGTVTVAAAKQMRDDKEWLTLSVSDTGIGIREDKLEAVFEEFSQADDSTTRDYGGTGLGLAISRRFCRMMGGDITVSSELGKGSVFTIELPTRVDALEAARESARPEKLPDRELGRGRGRILVVDDDPDSRELLKRTLESDGFAVTTAATGEDGLRLARELQPMMITLDVLMPSMDGWSVLQKVKADPELEKIPVMMISIAGDKDLGYTLGAVESLTKPVDREHLRQVARMYAKQAGVSRALVVDDDEAIRSFFQRALSDDGWTVATAENGAVALEEASEHVPDLVLLDLMMPVMDGFEFVMHFRKLAGCSTTPVIVVTAKDLDKKERESLLGHVERIVEKGALTREQILKQVRETVSQYGRAADGPDSSGDDEG